MLETTVLQSYCFTEQHSTSVVNYNKCSVDSFKATVLFLCWVQLEESEFTCATAVKARKSMEVEIEDLHVQMEDISKAKQAVSTSSVQL